jgi:hypothetical protein
MKKNGVLNVTLAWFRAGSPNYRIKILPANKISGGSSHGLECAVNCSHKTFQGTKLLGGKAYKWASLASSLSNGHRKFVSLARREAPTPSLNHGRARPYPSTGPRSVAFRDSEWALMSQLYAEDQVALPQGYDAILPVCRSFTRSRSTSSTRCLLMPRLQ